MRAGVIGEALVDVLPDGRALPGGSPMNVAVGLARLGHDVEFATDLGVDGYGTLVAEHVAAAGVRLVAGSVMAGATSVARATLDDEGRASYEFELRWQPPAPPTAGLDLLHTGSIGAILPSGAEVVAAALREARAGGVLVSFDPNVRPGIMGARDEVLGRVEELTASAHIVKLSDEDAEWLYPGVDPADVLDRLLAAGASVAVVTRGPDGCLARTGTTELALPAAPVVVADTIGAGDAFMSGLLHGVATTGSSSAIRGGEDFDLATVLQTALASARVAVSRPGANPPWPEELAAARG
ncbi:carbohydrate kinase family protein [Microbacterium sp.]|uniref:carbohydrate kinase family protein n=1 Tax=Microbacterium sp. TaxID=51671 RepID=UPI0039E67101